MLRRTSIFVFTLLICAACVVGCSSSNTDSGKQTEVKPEKLKTPEKGTKTAPD